MTLYNQTLDKLEAENEILQRDKIYVIKLSEQQRNELGFFNVIVGIQPDSRYYTAIKSGVLNGNIYEVSYTSVDRPLQEVKDYKLSLLASKAAQEEESFIVDSTLGYNVKGSRNDLKRFEVNNKRGWVNGRDSDGVARSISPTEYNTIITAIEDRDKAIQDVRWAKFDAIKLLGTVAEVEAYDIATGW